NTAGALFWEAATTILAGRLGSRIPERSGRARGPSYGRPSRAGLVTWLRDAGERLQQAGHPSPIGQRSIERQRAPAEASTASADGRLLLDLRLQALEELDQREIARSVLDRLLFRPGRPTYAPGHWRSPSVADGIVAV